MLQPELAARDHAHRVQTTPDPGAPGARPRALPRVQALIDAGRERNAARSTSWWESALESLRGLLRPPILRHAVAALRRGNLEAAFALLHEEVKVRPGNSESALLFWNVALTCGRAREAADAMVRLVRAEASAENGLEQAANHWTALVGAVPEAVVDVSALAKIVPLLRARSEATRGEAARAEADALLVDALRRCVDPAHGSLNPALALRIVEEARGIDIEVARCAVQVALKSSSLHEAKRTRLEDLLRELERGQWPDAQAADAPARPAAPPRAVPRKAERPAAPPASRSPATPKPNVEKPKVEKPKAEKPKVENPKEKRAPTGAAEAARSPAPARPTRARAGAAAVEAEPETEAPRGRRTVALTQDEIEAASSRLAERMAAHRAAPAPPQDDPPQPPPPAVAPAAALPILDAGEALDDIEEPLEKDEPIAILEQDEAIAILEEDAADAILEEDDANAILEVDAESADLEADAAGAVLEAEEPAGAPLEGDEPEAVIETSGTDFEFGGAASAEPGSDAEAELLEDASSEDFEIGTALEGEEPDADFEIGTALEDEAPAAELESSAAPGDEAGADFEFGSAAGAEASAAPEPLSDAVSEALREATRANEAPALRAIDILPVEIGGDGMVAYEVAHAQRTRVDYRAIEAIAAAEVTGLAEEPVLVALLVLRARSGRPRSALRMRCDTFDPASLFPDRTDTGQALRAMLSDLLERTRAVPLPDPDSALAIAPQRFESLPAFEAAVLARLPG